MTARWCTLPSCQFSLSSIWTRCGPCWLATVVMSPEATCRRPPAAGGAARGPGDDVSPHRAVNDAAMSNFEAWVPKLDIANIQPTSGGYQGTAQWRKSNKGNPVEARAPNLSIHARGIVDHGDRGGGSNGKTYTPINLVMASMGWDARQGFLPAQHMARHGRWRPAGGPAGKAAHRSASERLPKALIWRPRERTTTWRSPPPSWCGSATASRRRSPSRWLVDQGLPSRPRATRSLRA